jgi:hypothetical protein
MDRIERTAIAERLHPTNEGVGERDAALGGGAEHRDGLRLEQRTKPLQHRKLVTGTLTGVVPGGGLIAQDHPRVDRGCAAFRHDQWVDVELGHLALQAHQQPVPAADLQQHVDQRVGIDRACSARAGEQRRTAQLREHRARIVGVDRRQAEGDVFQDLDEDAAETDHDHRAEMSIRIAADHDLLAARCHLLDQPAVDARTRDRRQPHHLFDRAANRPRAIEMEPYASCIALMQKIG